VIKVKHIHENIFDPALENLEKGQKERLVHFFANQKSSLSFDGKVLKSLT